MRWASRPYTIFISYVIDAHVLTMYRIAVPVTMFYSYIKQLLAVKGSCGLILIKDEATDSKQPTVTSQNNAL